MAFLLYKVTKSDPLTISRTEEGFSLAGKNNLIHKAWENRNFPLDKGWSVTEEELVKLHDSNASCSTKRLVIDFDPESKTHIGLMEILEIYAYTHGVQGPDIVGWTPLMLRLRVLRDVDDVLPANIDEGKSIIEISKENEEIIEFLYLNGNAKSWNWGKNGRTNAALIDESSRSFFKQFF